VTSASKSAPEETIIEPGRAERNYWRDLWRFRELLYFLAYRDILVRYKQTVIGVAWALLRPALTMLVFVAFRRMTKQVSVGAPDAIFVYAALRGARGAGRCHGARRRAERVSAIRRRRRGRAGHDAERLDAEGRLRRPVLVSRLRGVRTKVGI
jgi:hypothetical protein